MGLNYFSTGEDITDPAVVEALGIARIECPDHFEIVLKGDYKQITKIGVKSEGEPILWLKRTPSKG